VSVFFGGKGHLTSIVAQERNDGGEKDNQNEIDGVKYLGWRMTPEDEDDLQNKKKDRKLNLSLHKEGELQSVIDPPGKKPRGHGKRRGNRSQDEEIETGDLKGKIFEEDMEKGKEG
jgi:hypothetical protein